jgi:hypothetical protein
MTPSSDSLGLTLIVTENNVDVSDDFGRCLKATWRPTCAWKPGGRHKMFQHNIFQDSKYYSAGFEDYCTRNRKSRIMLECAKCIDRVSRRFILIHTVGRSAWWAMGSGRNDVSLNRNRRLPAGIMDTARRNGSIWRRSWSESLRKETWRPPWNVSTQYFSRFKVILCIVCKIWRLFAKSEAKMHRSSRRVSRRFILMHTVGSSTWWAVGSSQNDGNLDRNRSSRDNRVVQHPVWQI